VWINLSAVQLGAPGCFERLVDVAAAIAPVTLGVELTEHTAVSDVMAGSLVLQRLVGAGIPVALDDFGTGYSSLGYLSQLPVSSVKIDQGFTSDLTRSHVARAVVRAVVSMCDELSLASVVEGVEDRTTLAGVTELGATHVSGYLLSRPVRARDLGTIPSELPGG
jgi:EAL domain-containing protein (putative c-di-GMP-specific phosphodiesterase class I)